MVAYVFNEELVNVAVFDSNGVSHSRTSVKLGEAGEDKPERGNFCEWTP
jgi:hypothetical protein